MRLAAVIVPLLLLTGCVQSLHPYYTDDQLTFDRNLIGYWSDADGKNIFDIPDADADPDARTYGVAYTDENGKTGNFVARLAKIDKLLLADLLPEELDDSKGGMYKVQFVPVHSFLLIEITKDTLKLRSMDYEWLKKELEAHPDTIAHERLGENRDRILFTAPSEKVQAFVLKHVNTPGAYGDWSEYKRTTPKPATRPAK